MLELGAAARGMGRVTAALMAFLAVLAGCGSVAGPARTASAGAVAGPASGSGAAGQARMGSAGSPRAAPPAAKAAVKHCDFLNGVSCASAEVTVTSRALLCTAFWRNFLAIVIAHNVAFRGWLAIKGCLIQ
jgi:hypothetical protein